MRFAILMLVVYVAAAAETSLVDSMRVGNATPDLLALVAVVWLLTAIGPQAFLAAGTVALAGDLIAPGHVGVGMAWMLLIGYAVTRLRVRFRGATGRGGLMWGQLVWQVPCVGVTVAVWAASVGLTGRLLGDVPLRWSTILAQAAGTGIYTGGVALPVLMVVGWIREPKSARGRKLTES